MTTKALYIRMFPKSYLASQLKKTDWRPDAEIDVVGGLETPYVRNSNLYKALKKSNMKMYITGERRKGGAEGRWFAVA